MSKRNFEINLLNYADLVITNDPKEIIFNNNDIFSDDLGTESSAKLVNIPSMQTNLQVTLDMAAARVLYIKNTNSAHSIIVKLNSNSGTAISIAPGKCMYLESTNDAGDPQITSLYVTNAAASAIVLKMFVSS